MPAGGIRQRMREVDAHGPDAHYERVKSKLALHLLLQILWGIMSSQQGQMLACLACADLEAVGGRPPDDLKNLSRIGCEGKYPQNCWRDLKKLLSEPMLTPPSSIWVPVKANSTRGYNWDELYFIDPHVIFADLYNDTAAWEAVILPSPADATSFWEEQVLAGSPRLVENPMLTVDDWKNKFVPLTLFGDGVPVTGVGKSWGKSMDSWNFKSALAKGSTTAISMLIVAIFVCSTVDGLAIPFGGTLMLALNLIDFKFNLYCHHTTMSMSYTT
jgi:hypothetical protein